MIALIREPSGRLRFDHYSPSPLVYLDHGPFMEVAGRHADEFVSALTRRNGTLALSWLHFLERGNVDEKTTAPIDALVLRLWPNHLVFVEVIPEAVIIEEDKLLAGGPLIAPHLDGRLIDALWQTRAPGPLEEMTPAGLLAAYRNPQIRDYQKKRWAEACTVIGGAIRGAAQLYKSNPALKRKFRAPLSGKPIPLPTRYIYEEGVHYIIKNGHSTPNHVADFFHTVVAVSCCDYVVLDSNWREAARQIQDKVRASGLLTHEARVFSVKEIPKFLHRLETDG